MFYRTLKHVTGHVDWLPVNLCTIVKLKIAVTEHSAKLVTEQPPKIHIWHLTGLTVYTLKGVHGDAEQTNFFQPVVFFPQQGIRLRN